MALGKPIVPVSALEALARAGARGDDSLVAPWVDAQRGEVFGAVYDSDGQTAIGEPTALSPTATLAALGRRRSGPQRFRFIGDGALRYADTITAALGPRAEVDPIVPPLAGVDRADRSGVAPTAPWRPHAVAPIYVRRPGRRACARQADPGSLTIRDARSTCLRSIAADDRRTTDGRRRPRRRRSAGSRVVHQPVDARDAGAGARATDVGARLRAAPPRRPRSRRSARAGSSSTSCTSTPSRSTPARRRQGLGRALMQHVLADVAARGRPPRDARSPALEPRRAAALRAISGSGGRCAETVLHAAGGRRADSVAQTVADDAGSEDSAQPTNRP